MRAVAGIMLAAMLASPAMAADQFDLVCKGTVKEAVAGRPKPTEVRYRIDIDAREWCRDACTETYPIAAVEPGNLVLREHVPERRGDFRSYQTVDRTSGAWADYFNDFQGLNGLYFETTGVCTADAFGGFPAKKF